MSALAKDGLIQRFIPVPLRAEQTRLGDPLPEYMTTAAAYDQMIRVCYGLPAMTYRLSGARRRYRTFQEWYNKRMSDERLLRSSETFQTALGKGRGLCGRIALVWHCIEAPLQHRGVRGVDVPGGRVHDPVRDPGAAVRVRRGTRRLSEFGPVDGRLCDPVCRRAGAHAVADSQEREAPTGAGEVVLVAGDPGGAAGDATSKMPGGWRGWTTGRPSQRGSPSGP